MPDVQPGREEDLRRLRRWLAFSERLDRLIEASEAPTAAALTALVEGPAPAAPARHARGLRAQIAAGLAPTALAVHREAAAAAVLRPEAAR